MTGGASDWSKCSALSSAQDRPSSLRSARSKTSLLLLAVLGTGALVFLEGVADTISTPVTARWGCRTAIAGAQLRVLGLFVVALTITTGVVGLARRRRGGLYAIIDNGCGSRHTIPKRRLAFRRIAGGTRAVLGSRCRTCGDRGCTGCCGGWRLSSWGTATTRFGLGTTKHEGGQDGEHDELMELHRFLKAKMGARIAPIYPVSPHWQVGTFHPIVQTWVMRPAQGEDMPNPAIDRDRVHSLAEACSDDGEGFQSTASRLIKRQRKLSRFFEQNVGPMGPMAAQVGLYMLSVSLRIFEQIGGRLDKVNGADLNAATAKIQGVAESLLPGDDGFVARAKAVEWRAQPHLLDEILWALFERGDKNEGEVDLEPEKAALVYLMLWAAVEGLDANWRAPDDIA